MPEPLIFTLSTGRRAKATKMPIAVLRDAKKVVVRRARDLRVGDLVGDFKKREGSVTGFSAIVKIEK